MNNPSIDWQMVLGPLADDRGCASHGGELEQAIWHHSRRAVRLRPELDPEQVPFETTSVPWFSRGRFLQADAVRPGAYLNHFAGDYYIQDAGSLLAMALCDIQPGQLVCDVCAAPGGKSTAIVEQLAGSGLLLANEVIASRQATLRTALWRSGYGNQLITQADVSVLAARYAQQFDCVLVDAPCSGQSMLARGKQSLAAFSAAQISHSSARQQRIMQAAARLVRPGGKLVYSTCTFSFAENEQIILQFMESDRNTWEFAPRLPGLDAWQSPLGAGYYRLWPHRDGCAGGFASALTRVDEARHNESAERAFDPKPTWQRIDALPDEVANWFDASLVGDPQPSDWYLVGDKIHRVPVGTSCDLLSKTEVATPIAQRRSDRWEPAFASSVISSKILTPRQSLPLSDDQAIQFASGIPLRFGSAELAAEIRGWCVATWRGRALAWGKVAAGVLKNHLPKSLRQSNLVIGK